MRLEREKMKRKRAFVVKFEDRFLTSCYLLVGIRANRLLVDKSCGSRLLVSSNVREMISCQQ